MPNDERWIRLDAHWSCSEWLESLDWCVRAVWPELLCLVKRSGMRGRLKCRPVSRIAGEMGIPTEYVQQLIDAALADGAMTIEDRHYVVTKWVQYQPKDSTERSQLHRARRAEEAEKASETPDSEESQVQMQRDATQCNATQRDATICSVTRDDLTTDDLTTDDRRLTSDKKRPDQADQGKKPRTRMLEPPTHEMVKLHFENHHRLPADVAEKQAGKFVAYHEGNSWQIRNEPMRNWKLAVQTWYRNLSEAEKGGSDYRTPVGKPNSTQNASAGQIDGKNGQLSGETSPRKTSIYNADGMIRAEEVPQEWLQ
jgi:hypothetical protein